MTATHHHRNQRVLPGALLIAGLLTAAATVRGENRKSVDLLERQNGVP